MANTLLFYFVVVTAQHPAANLQHLVRKMQAEHGLAVQQVQPRLLGDTLQPVFQRVIVNVHLLGGLNNVLIVFEVDRQRLPQVSLLLLVVLHQNMHRWMHKAHHVGPLGKDKQHML